MNSDSQVKELVYQAVERGNSHDTGRAILERAEQWGATVIELPKQELSRDAYYDGFHAPTRYKIVTPGGQYTHVYWQPRRWTKEPDTDGLWYGRATQWEPPRGSPAP